MEDIETRDVRVKIEDATTIYVGRVAVEALRDDAHVQLHEALTEVHGLWSQADSDVEDLEYLKKLEWPLSTAKAALSVLIQLAPMPDEDEEDA